MNKRVVSQKLEEKSISFKCCLLRREQYNGKWEMTLGNLVRWST